MEKGKRNRSDKCYVIFSLIGSYSVPSLEIADGESTR